STILKTIAWLFEKEDEGFAYDDWSEVLDGHDSSRTLAVIQPRGSELYVRACSKASQESLDIWSRSLVERMVNSLRGKPSGWQTKFRTERLSWSVLSIGPAPESGSFNYAAYAPTKALRHLPNPDLSITLPSWSSNCLAFENTVQNALIQSWLLSLY